MHDMNTDKIGNTLLDSIKDILLSLGVPSNLVNQLDEVIYLILILVLAFALGELVHYVTVRFTKKVLKFKDIRILDSLIKYKALRKISYLVPPLVIAALLPFAFENKPHALDIAEKITWIYFVVALVVSVNVVLSSVGNVILVKGELHDRPMKSFVQILQVLFSFIAVIVVISILINKSPFNLITGLGAFAAVLMLIFKDSILGFVAGVLLSQNDMIHLGDWIEMDQ